MSTQTPVHATIKNWKQQNCTLGDNWVNYMEPVSTMLYLVLKIYFSCVCMSVCLHACLCIICMPDALRIQKRMLDPLGLDGYEPLCACWELDPDPPEEQPALLTTQLSLQPHQ